MVTLLWKPGWGYFKTISQSETNGDKKGALDLVSICGPDYKEYRFLQIMSGNDQDALAVCRDREIWQDISDNAHGIGCGRNQLTDTTNGGSQWAGASSREENSRELSPILEGSHGDSQDTFDSLATFLKHDDPDLHLLLQETRGDFDSILEEVAEQVEEGDGFPDLDSRVPLQYFQPAPSFE